MLLTSIIDDIIAWVSLIEPLLTHFENTNQMAWNICKVFMLALNVSAVPQRPVPQRPVPQRPVPQRPPWDRLSGTDSVWDPKAGTSPT